MASSSPPPAWAILGGIPTMMDELPPGFEANIRLNLVAPPGVSWLTVPESILPSVITHRDPNNPTILAIDPSSGIILLHAILRRTGSDSPIRICRPGGHPTIVRREFVASYFVLDEASDSALPIPNAGLLRNPAEVGIIYSTAGGGRYAVAELQLQEGASHAILLSFVSHVGDWVKKRIPYPSLPRQLLSDCVLSYDGRLWWVDLSFGLIACDPFAHLPVLTVVVQLPSDKRLDYREESLFKRRLMRVSAGKLRFVDMYRNLRDGRGVLKVSVWTLKSDSAPTSSLWNLEHEASFTDIWADSSYKATGLGNEEPVLALIHPFNPRVVYFFLKDRLFGVDVPTHSIVEPKLSPCKDLISSRFLHTWVRPMPSSFFSGQIKYATNSGSEVNRNGFKWQSIDLLGYDMCYKFVVYIYAILFIFKFSKFQPFFFVSFRSYIDQSFRVQYDRFFSDRHRVDAKLSNVYIGERGQIMACASRALQHYNATNMATKRRSHVLNDVSNISIGADQAGSSPEIELMASSNNFTISTAHLNMMEQFVEFCKFKKEKQRAECNNQSKKNQMAIPTFDVNKFRSQLMLLYGSCLPANVIEDICLLLIADPLSKCKQCQNYSEKLVLDILHVLSQAASKKSAKGMTQYAQSLSNLI